jgi:acetyl-CoA C-acetyltransferase
MMSDVVIAGIGQTEVGEHFDVSLRDLALMAISEARRDAGGLRPEVMFVANMLAPASSRQAHLGALLADYANLLGIEGSTVEAGGASGGAALRLAFMAVASGEANVALAIGVEKVTDQIGPGSEATWSLAIDSDYEAVQGLTPTAQAAIAMRRYMYEYGVPHEAFGGFAITAHENAVHNPHAMFRSAISKETYNKAGLVSDPLNMFDIAPVADGAAAVILTRADLLPSDTPHKLVHIRGSNMTTDRLALHDRTDLLAFDASRTSVQRACRQAGILPGDVDLFELTDSYSIYAALSLEAAGFAERGQGWKLATNGNISLHGLLPIATFGGMKARGNPGGAAGMYQAVEATIQLRGQAGENQVPGARRALIQSLAGPASSAVTHVLEVL